MSKNDDMAAFVEAADAVHAELNRVADLLGEVDVEIVAPVLADYHVARERLKECKRCDH